MRARISQICREVMKGDEFCEVTASRLQQRTADELSSAEFMEAFSFRFDCAHLCLRHSCLHRLPARLLAGVFAMAAANFCSKRSSRCRWCCRRPFSAFTLSPWAREAPGKFWQAAFGHGLAFTFTGLVIASVLYSLAVRRAAARRSFRKHRSQASRRIRRSRRWRAAYVSPRHFAAVDSPAWSPRLV